MSAKETDDPTATEICDGKDNTAQCNICEAKVTDNCDAVECEHCSRWQHSKWADLTDGEFKMLKRSRCKLTWLCSECKPQIIRPKNEELKKQIISDMTAQMQSIMEKITKSLEQKIKEEIHNAIKKN